MSVVSLIRDLRELIEAKGQYDGARHVVSVSALRRVIDRHAQIEVASDAKCREILACLSRQKRRVCLGIREGKPNKQIAAELGIGEQVVKNYAREIFQKLGVHTRLQLGLLLSEEVLPSDGSHEEVKQ